MSINSSSSCNSSLPPSPSTSSSSIFYQLHSCFSSTAGIFSITAFTICSILLLLPLYILVLHLGCQRWRHRSSGTTMSHSDIFTYHMVIIELISVFGSSISCCGVHANLPEMLKLGVFLLSVNMSGQMLFHILTCAERYLAVVHPITYLGLRKTKGIRIRNIIIGCVWILCFAATGSMTLRDEVSMLILSFSVLGFTLSVISFCSISVLCTLIRPGPADRVEGQQQIDQSKLRAFYTIMAILGVLLIRFGGNVFTSALRTSVQLSETERCGLWLAVCWFNLPSSLVLPLLFLNRAGKLPCCKKNNEPR